MRVMAQMAMVMNLDKCIGCHTCSVTCKQAWTNRAGTEYVWFNNVETRPGLGYPRGYEDQDEWQGGWVSHNGRLRLRAGGRLKKLLTIFSNPKMPSIQDYYEPWTYDYETLLNAPAQKNFPVARPHSLISGKPINVSWSANWDDDLGGSREHAAKDVMLRGIEDKVTFEFEQTFMFYLPRICEHCLNPSCAASCPSGAIYKREEDGIVLVDQDRCRGWRMCITGCPYKKVYFNHKTGKAEKCTFCYPRIEVGIPTVCSETCVGRLRYIGLVLYDADKVLEAASAPDDTDLYESQLGVFLDPEDPEVRRAAEAAGIPGDWVEAARRSPVKKLIMDYKVALPLHPEYRTMPMVWYIPPLSPVVDVIKDTGYDAEDVDNLFGAIDTLRIPVEYLANLFTAGDVAPVNGVLKKLAAMRSYMRDINLGRDPRDEIPAAVGMEGEDDVRHVPPPRARQVRGPVRHPHRARRAGARPRGARHRLRRLRVRRRPGDLRRGVGRGADAGGRRELPRAAGDPVGRHDAGAALRQPDARTGQPAHLGRPRDAGRHVPQGRHRPRRGSRAMRWRRQRDARPGLSERELVDTWQVVSLLLDYPDAVLVQRVPMLRSVVATLPDAQRHPLVELLDTLERGDLGTLQADYVDTFDVTRKCSLHLTYFAEGDTRRRGVALVEFKQAYRRAGVEFDTDVELPDHLCVVLEFGAVQDWATAWHLLNRHRVGIEVLRAGLAQRSSPWLPAVEALRTTLPELDGDDETALLRLVAEGPPQEEVGLEPYAIDPRLNPRPDPVDTTALLGPTIPVGAPR